MLLAQELKDKRLRDLISKNAKEQNTLNLASYEEEMNKIKFKKGYITVKSDVRDKILLLSHEIFRNRKLRQVRPQREKMDRRHRFSYSVTDMSPESFACDDKANLQKILS